MKQILGFSVISALVDNVPEAMSLLGELSTQAATYSMTKGEYTNPLNPGYRLETFSVKDPVSGLDTTLTSEEALLAIAVTKACVDYAATAPIPVNPQDFRMAIAADFIDVIDSLEFGELLTASGTTLPTWFSFTAKAGVRNEYKIWLADSAFLIQYPEYDVKVVPPMPELNLFLGNWQNAVNALAEWPNTALIEAVGAAANLQPYSYLSYYEFDFVNRLNPAQKHKTSWYVLTYGEAGNNEDIHKDAIIDLLVKTTGRPEADWMPIFPELFKRTEFVGYPRWDRMSIPNASTLTGLYSSILYLQNSIDYADVGSPPEELNVLQAGKHYGWPYCVADRQPARGYEKRFDCAATVAPRMLWPAHAAPLQMVAGPSGSRFAGQVLVAWHGYKPAGHRVVGYSRDAQGLPAGQPVEWLGGWDAKPGVRPLGKPTGLTVDRQGRLLVVEDLNRTVLMLLPSAPKK